MGEAKKHKLGVNAYIFTVKPKINFCQKHHTSFEVVNNSVTTRHTLSSQMYIFSTSYPLLRLALFFEFYYNRHIGVG